jgi:hypothetical protein
MGSKQNRPKRRHLLQSYIPVDEVAQDLGKHPRTIKRWIESGFLVGIRLPKAQLVDVVASHARLAELANKQNRTGVRTPESGGVMRNKPDRQSYFFPVGPRARSKRNSTHGCGSTSCLIPPRPTARSRSSAST